MPRVTAHERHGSGLVAVDGLIVGQVRGSVNGVFRGTIDGDVDVRLLSGKMDGQDGAPEPDKLPPEPEPVLAEKPAGAADESEKEAGADE